MWGAEQLWVPLAGSGNRAIAGERNGGSRRGVQLLGSGAAGAREGSRWPLGYCSSGVVSTKLMTEALGEAERLGWGQGAGRGDRGLG